MRKWLFIMVVLALVLTPFSAASVRGQEKYTIGFLTGTLDNPFWITMKEHAEAKAEELGVELILLGAPKETDIDKQISMMEDLIARGVDAIVVAALDTVAIVPAIEHANEVGIPVLCVDKSAAGGELASVIMTDNIKGAGLGAEFVAEQIGGKGKVLVLEGAAGHETAMHRRDGSHQKFAEYPDIEVISQPADWETAKALAVTENVLAANPDLAGVFASNDLMAFGAISALEAAGKEDVVVCGFDAIPDAVQMVKDGVMDATVAQFPGKMGELGVEYAIKAIEGEEIPATVDTGTALVTPENADEFLGGPPPLVVEGEYTIGFLTGTLDNPFWITMKEHAEAKAEELGVELILLGAPKETDIDKQISMMEDLIARGVDAIVVAALDTVAIVPAIEHANEVGIPVLCVDKSAAGGELASVIMTDNIKGAGLGAEFVAEQIGGKGKVLVLEGAAGHETAMHRRDGSHQKFAEYPDIEVISQPADWETAKALAVTENVLAANPDLAGVFASNDLMAFGAISALEAAGKEDVVVCGFDAIPDAVQMVKDGVMDATVAQFPGKMGEMGVEYAIRAIQGEEVPATVDTGTALVTAENADEFLP